MIQLNRSMMDRYEIADRRPQTLRCLVFGADSLMLGAVCRLIDRANEAGRDIGAACICERNAADCLNAQDGMLTMMIRGENSDGSPSCEERVLQGVLCALDPDRDFARLMEIAAQPQVELIFCHAAPDDVEIGMLARILAERSRLALKLPQLVLLSGHPDANCAEDVKSAVCAVARAWQQDVSGAGFTAALAETLCGAILGPEREKRMREMNYRDDLIAWAEPQLRIRVDGEVPSLLQGVDGICSANDFNDALIRKARIFDSAVFLCASLGFLCGMDSFSQVMKDEQLRGWIGHAFFDEILLGLPYARDEIAPDVISAFERLENSMNDMRLMEIGRDLLRNFSQTLLPAIRSHAQRHFEAPRYIALALSAAIMIYAGARRDEAGHYCVQHGGVTQRIRDDDQILEDFSRLAHDMPAESLAYAALANRAAWGDDLREIDGLEMRVVFDLSAIQRIGLREAMKIEVE